MNNELNATYFRKLIKSRKARLVKLKKLKAPPDILKAELEMIEDVKKRLEALLN